MEWGAFGVEARKAQEGALQRVRASSNGLAGLVFGAVARSRETP